MEKEERLKINYKAILAEVDKADNIARKYTQHSDISDIAFFESCKIELNNVMLDLSSHYARYKTGNDYYDQHRKQVKAERLEYMVETEKVSITKAKELVYKDSVYKEFMVEYNLTKKIYYLVSRKYIVYEATLQNIKQTISNLKKELQYENELLSFRRELEHLTKLIKK